MSKLSTFLHPVAVSEEKEIVISKRFQDEKGNPVPFKIRALTQEENETLVKAATISYRDRTGANASKFDRFKYIRSLVVEGTLEPDFRAKELCDAYGVLDPLQIPGKMLYAGEFQRLGDAIAELSGIGDDLEEEVKN